MVFQSYALFPNMSVYRNIEYGLRLRGDEAGKLSARVAEMLDIMQIRHLADRRIEQLSGGQRQRVALAWAIAVRPRVLFLDEPLTALDAKLRHSLREEIDTLLKRLGITAVYVTHDQGEAMALGDVVVVMNHGEVVQQGPPSTQNQPAQCGLFCAYPSIMPHLYFHYSSNPFISLQNV